MLQFEQQVGGSGAVVGQQRKEVDDDSPSKKIVTFEQSNAVVKSQWLEESSKQSHLKPKVQNGTTNLNSSITT